MGAQLLLEALDRRLVSVIDAQELFCLVRAGTTRERTVFAIGIIRHEIVARLA